jgi:hypothetical protein
MKVLGIGSSEISLSANSGAVAAFDKPANFADLLAASPFV